ncbi:MAG TPA: hypothetical protein VF725_13000 [Ktedonobacterales bacterium]
MPMTGLIDERIERLAAHGRQRAWLVTTVALAQALITVVIIPGFIIPTPNLPVLLTLGVALAFYLVAFLVNRLRHDDRVAVVILIGGGALATAAQAIVTALLTHDGARAAQAALLFLPLTLEAGLFFASELTLYVASACSIATACAVLLAFALSSDATPVSQVYLVVVYSLGLQGFIGFLAWRLAQFINEKVEGSEAAEDRRFAQAQLAASQRRVTDQRHQLMQDLGVIQFAVSSALAHDYNHTRIEVADGALAPLATSLTMLIQQVRATNELEVKLQRLEAQAVPLVELANRLATGAPPVAVGETPTDSVFYPVIAALNQALMVNARRQYRLQEVAVQIADSLRHSREGFASTAGESARAEQHVGRLVSLIGNLVTTSQRQLDLLGQARRALALVLPSEITRDDLADPSLREPAVRDTEGTGDLQGLGADIGIMRTGFTEEMDILQPVDLATAGISPLTTPMRAVDTIETDDESPTDETPALTGDTLPAGLGDAWLALTQLHAQTADEARAVNDLNHDIGLLKRYVRQTGVGIDWIAQAIEAIERNSDQMQRLASLSGASLDALDEPGASSSVYGMRGASNSIPRRAPLATRPQEGETRLPLDADSRAGAEAAASDAVQPAPGSLRVSDLIGLDVLGGPGLDPSGPITPGSLGGGGENEPQV